MYLWRCLAQIRPTITSGQSVYIVHKHGLYTRLLSTHRPTTTTTTTTTTPHPLNLEKVPNTAAELDTILESASPVIARAIYARVKANKTGKFEDTDQRTEAIALNSLTSDNLHMILGPLVRSGMRRYISLVHNILAEMHDVFGVDVTLHTHFTIIKAFAESQNIMAARRWLLRMHEKPGNIPPTLSLWHILIKACIHTFDQLSIPHLIQEMESTGCSPTLETYRILFTSMLRHKPDIVVIKSILQKMSKVLPYDPTIRRILSQEYTDNGLVPAAEEMSIYYDSLHGREEPEKDEYTRKLMEAYRQKNRYRAVKELEKLQASGFLPTIDTLRSLVAHSVSVQDIEFWETTLNISADVAAWACVIRNCVERAGSIDKALQVYEKFESTGLIPTSALILPIIRVLCMKTLRSPKENDIDRALVIYTNFFRVTSFGEPNAIVYNTLISALASTINTAKYFPKALALLEDMQSREVVMDSITATSITILLVRSSTNPSEAFQAYKRIFKRPDGRPTLDAEGYVAVLNVFCRLTFGKRTIHSAIPPWEQYFEIVKDMREMGFPVNVKVYTIILQQLGLAATKFRQARYPIEDAEQFDLNQLERAIRKIHQLMTIDASIEPDTIAWNTLMDAYQRAGCVRDAYRVWDSLWVTRMFDNASVSIIADACGHAQAFNEALQIFGRLRAVGFALNVRNWNSWLECLCRLGRLDEAVKIMCLEMGQNGNPEPDLNSARIVLRFASGSRHDYQVRERIKRYLPELWRSLPEDLTL